MLKGVCHNGAVISKQELMHQSLCDLGFGSETSQIKESTIRLVFHVHSSIILGQMSILSSSTFRLLMEQALLPLCGLSNAITRLLRKIYK